MVEPQLVPIRGTIENPTITALKTNRNLASCIVPELFRCETVRDGARNPQKGPSQVRSWIDRSRPQLLNPPNVDSGLPNV